MTELTTAFAVIGLAFLRLGVPILVLWLLGKALSVENKVAEPGSLEDALRPPHAIFWGDKLSIIQAFAADPATAAAPAAAALRALAEE